MSSDIGRIMIYVGGGILILGIIIHFAGDKMKWIGNLPGDIQIERENFKMYFPITTLLLLSLVINILFRLIKYIK